MKLYGFFVVSRKKRWRVSPPGDDLSEWFDAKEEASLHAERWQQRTKESRDQAFQEALENSARARAEFIGECTVEIVTVPNNEPFQADSKKPTVTFPDGEAIQFGEDTDRATIDEYIETRARNEHPDPSRGNFDVSVEIEESAAWGAELFIGGTRRRLPDIESWSYFFPMDSVAATLNDLAGEGWSVVHVSEDRGLYTSDIVQNMSAPVAARYMLVRSQPNTEGL